jgi:hypothetical protein
VYHGTFKRVKLDTFVRSVAVLSVAIGLVMILPTASASAALAAKTSSSNPCAQNPPPSQPDTSGWHYDKQVKINVIGEGTDVYCVEVGSASGNTIAPNRNVFFTDGPDVNQQTTYDRFETLDPNTLRVVIFDVYDTFPNTWWICGGIQKYTGFPCVEIKA